MAILSVRVTHSEANRLRARAGADGFDNLSLFIRHVLGLANRIDQASALPEAEEDVLKLLVAQTEHLRDQERMLKRIAQTLGVNTDKVPVKYPKPVPVPNSGEDFARS